MVPTYYVSCWLLWKSRWRKARCLYIEMCHDICHILLYSNFFNPYSMECV